MERQLPNEIRLKNLFSGPNTPGNRLQVANIFKQSNFGLGKGCK